MTTNTTTEINRTNTTATLEEARADLHNAVAAHDDTHRRTQYARSALDNAVTVLLADDGHNQLALAHQVPRGRADHTAAPGAPTNPGHHTIIERTVP